MSDLHWGTSAQLKHSSVTTPTADDEEAAVMGAWPMGSVDLKGGKKGDIFRLVCFMSVIVPEIPLPYNVL